MKLYNRDDFMKLPEGTLYVLFTEGPVMGETLERREPSGMIRKGQTLYKDDGEPWDWLTKDLSDINNAHYCHGPELDYTLSYHMEDLESRDGSFDDTDLFMVYGYVDLIEIQDHVRKALELTK